MKKRILLLPVLGAFLLSGCKIVIGNKVIKIFEKKESENQENQNNNNNNNNQPSGGEQEEEIDTPILKEEFGDYER